MNIVYTSVTVSRSSGLNFRIAIQVGLADKTLSTGRPSDVTTSVEICAIRTLPGMHISACMRKLIHSTQIMTFVVSAPGCRLKETPGEERDAALYGDVGENSTHY